MTPPATEHDTLRELLDQSLAASLAVLDAGSPAVSLVTYTCTWSPLRLYLCISELSSHTPALRAAPRCSLLIHRDPSPSDPHSNHAITRAMIQCDAKFISRDEAELRGVTSQWRAKYAITDMLLGLSDFSFVELTPLSGTLILGFGRAFRCTGENLAVLEHQRPR